MGLLSSFGIIRRKKKKKNNSTIVAAVAADDDANADADDDDADADDDDDDDDADISGGPVFDVKTTVAVEATSSIEKNKKKSKKNKNKKNRRGDNNNKNNNNSSSSPFTLLHNDGDSNNNDATTMSVCIKSSPAKKKKKWKKKKWKKKKKKKKKRHDNGHATTAHPRASTVVTLDHVPDLILDLETAVIVNAKRPIRALQMLFKLSSSGSSSGSSSSSNTNTNTTRIGMVHQKDNEGYRYGQRLVLTLLKYIKRCTPQSNEHNLALIVLNNISIPPENKKTIALDCNGIEILSKLLCEDPSCHLIAIVLVNLTYDYGDSSGSSGSGSSSSSSSSSSLRKQLLDCKGKTSLIESLAFALRVSSLTPNEYEARQTTIDECNYSDESYFSPVIRLSILMAKDQQLRSSQQQQQQQQPSPTKEEILLQLRSDEEELQQLDKLVRLSSSSSSSSSMKMDRSRGRGENITHSRRRRHDHPPPRPPSSSSITMMKDDDEEEDKKLNDYDHDYLYPETTKWCLYALRNLSQPLSFTSTSASVCNNDDNDNDNDDPTTTSIVANILIKSGIYSLILQQFVNASVVSSVPSSSQSATLHAPIATSSCESITTKSSSSSSNTTLTNNNNNKNESNSNNNLILLLQDTAISIILNLSACTKSREYMNEPETVRVLTAQCNNDNIMSFQRLKARMALSYLIGSQGHFGQSKLRSTASTVQANRKNSALIVSSHTEVHLLLELLVNTLYHRGKDNNNSGGGGGYLVGAFNLKCVLFSLRCLLTHMANQETIAKSIGLDLNTILMNILARYAFDEEEDGRSIIDSDSAEHIVFCLYLLSNYGFAGFGDQEMSSFLPDMYSPPPSRTLGDVDHGLAANILITYLRRSENNNNDDADADVKASAGCHAAKELLLRLKYMNFRNHNPNTCRKTYHVSPEDLKINYILLAKIKRVRIPDRKHGSKPNPMIFHHPVLRYQKPLSTKSVRMPLWNNYNPAAVSNFANALLAVQQLSYGSIKVRRSSHHRSSSEPIDDIAIANNIVHCANNKMEVCYNFMWAWEDFKIKETHEDEDDDDMHDSSRSKFTAERIFGCVEGIDSPIPNKSRTTQKPLGPMSFWGGVICCAMDHSINGDDGDDATLYTK